MRLFDIDQKIEKLLYDHLDDGEIMSEAPDLVADLAELSIEKKTAVLDLACAYRDYTVQANAVREAEDAIAARRIALEKKAAVIKATLEKYAYGEVYEDPRIRVRWTKSRRVVLTIEADELPEEFKRVKVEPKRMDLKTAIDKDKRKIEGVSVVESLNIQMN